MKVAIYARVSTDEQNANAQVLASAKYAESQGWEIYAVYSDVSSGAKASRPAWNNLLKDMRQYKFRAVVVTKLDRIGRSLQHLLSTMDEFQNKRVELVCVTQNIDTTTPQGRFMWQILGAFAEFEREIIRERTREGLKHSPNRHKVGKRGKDKKPRQKRGVLRK